MAGGGASDIALAAAAGSALGELTARSLPPRANCRPAVRGLTGGAVAKPHARPADACGSCREKCTVSCSWPALTAAVPVRATRAGVAARAEAASDRAVEHVVAGGHGGAARPSRRLEAAQPRLAVRCREFWLLGDATVRWDGTFEPWSTGPMPESPAGRRLSAVLTELRQVLHGGLGPFSAGADEATGLVLLARGHCCRRMARLPHHAERNGLARGHSQRACPQGTTCFRPALFGLGPCRPHHGMKVSHSRKTTITAATVSVRLVT